MMKGIEHNALLHHHLDRKQKGEHDNRRWNLHMKSMEETNFWTFNPEVFAERLDLLINEQKGRFSFLQQKQIAEEAGISEARVSGLIHGNVNGISVQNLVRLADYYHVSTDYLLGRSDIKSFDTGLQYICDYIGLNERTIKTLNEESQKCINSICQVLNVLLASDSFIQMLRSISKMLQYQSMYEYITDIFKLRKYHFSVNVGSLNVGYLQKNFGKPKEKSFNVERDFLSMMSDIEDIEYERNRGCFQEERKINDKKMFDEICKYHQRELRLLWQAKDVLVDQAQKIGENYQDTYRDESGYLYSRTVEAMLQEMPPSQMDSSSEESPVIECLYDSWKMLLLFQNCSHMEINSIKDDLDMRNEIARIRNSLEKGLFKKSNGEFAAFLRNIDSTVRPTQIHVNENTIPKLLDIHKRNKGKIEAIDEALHSFERYHESLYSWESLYMHDSAYINQSVMYTRRSEKVDERRDDCRSALLKSVGLLNKLAKEASLQPFCDEDTSENSPKAYVIELAVLNYIRQIVTQAQCKSKP